MTVIGCVWGAHAALRAEGVDVTYDWCEAAYRAYGLGRLLGPAPIDPVALVGHLRVFHANGWLPLELRCKVCGRDIASAGSCVDGVMYCPAHVPGAEPVGQQALF